MEDIFFRTCQYLTLCSRAGIIFNKKKFQLGSKIVDFLGFTITEDSVKPSADYIEAIKDFPGPKDITGIRSFFGLINQVAYAFAQTQVVLPFRELLKPSSKFLWTSELVGCVMILKSQNQGSGSGSIEKSNIFLSLPTPLLS